MTHPQTNDDHKACPRCGSSGKKVGQITLESLLTTESSARITDEPYRFCESLDCPVVYFGEAGGLFVKDDLTVRIGVKEHDAPRLICYCFDHTIEEINAQVAQTGKSGVLDDIKERMKDECWCQTKSPMGSCCLGTVGKYTKLAHATYGHDQDTNDAGHDETYTDCCNSDGQCEQSEPSGQRAGMMVVGGSVIAALAASACCWIPLGLILLGLSAGGVSAWFEHYRWLFLGLTTILLGAGFYMVYFRPSSCTAGSACASPSKKVQRFNRSMLWIATIFVIASASFPKYVGLLIPTDQPMEPIGSTDQIATGSITIQGMTCEACAIPLKNSLSKVEGVLDLSVSYETSQATIQFDKATPPSMAELNKAIQGTGYEATIDPSQGFNP